MSTEAKTVWYRNTEQDTFHKVAVGTDTEKRMRGELRPVGEDGDETFEKAFERVSEKEALTDVEKQPGYPSEAIRKEHAAAAAEKAPKLTEADVDKRVQDALDSFIASLPVAETPSPTPAPKK